MPLVVLNQSERSISINLDQWECSTLFPGILIVGGESTYRTAELFMPTVGVHCSLPDLPANHPKAQTGSLQVRDPGVADPSSLMCVCGVK